MPPRIPPRTGPPPPGRPARWRRSASRYSGISGSSSYSPSAPAPLATTGAGATPSWLSHTDPNAECWGTRGASYSGASSSSSAVGPAGSASRSGPRPRPRPRPPRRRRRRGGAPAAAAPARSALGFLVAHFGHGQVALGGHASAAARGILLHLRDLGDVDEGVGDVDEVGAGVAAEADDLDPHAHLLHGPDGRREVPVAGDDDRDVEVLRGAHHVHDELDVEVRLDLAVAVLADVLADDLVAAACKEAVELALVLVLGVEPRVGVGAGEGPPRRRRLQQRHVVDVHAGRPRRVED